MPSLKAVRTRIASVKSTQKITSAMKLVAAAKLRRAQDAIVAARPYANALSETVGEIALRAGDDAHPMLARRAGRRLTVVAVTSDRGLCGAFNTNVCRAAHALVDERRAAGAVDDIRIDVVGRKGREYFKRRRLPVGRELAGVTGESAIDRAKEVALGITEDFSVGRTDGVILVYNVFRSAISQKATTDTLLPVARIADDATAAIDFVYEPEKPELLARLLPLYIESQIYRAFLESIASEFGARMTAMDSASRSAKEMIERLTLQYNRARQAAITKELMEIVSGAEALKG